MNSGTARAHLLELPEGDEAVRAHHEDAGARGQAVQTVGDVRAVGCRDPDERDPREIQQPPEDGSEGHERQHLDVAEHRHVRRRRSLADPVREVQGDDRERDEDDHLAEDLPPAGQAEAALTVHFHVVVDEPDRAQAHHEPDDEQPGDRGRVVARVRAYEIADHRADDEDRAAHRGCAALLAVARVVHILGRADHLPPAPLAEQTHEDGRQEQGECQRDRSCRQK